MDLILKSQLSKHPSEQHVHAFFQGNSSPNFELWKMGSLTYSLQFHIPQHNTTWINANSPQLWKGTCFEFFLKSGTHYWEWNWNLERKTSLYRLKTWRQTLHQEEALRRTGITSININGTPRTHSFTIVAELDLSLASPNWNWFQQANSPIEWQACCILKNCDEAEHWSSKHSSTEKPDFHTPESFQVLEISPRD